MTSSARRRVPCARLAALLLAAAALAPDGALVAPAHAAPTASLVPVALPAGQKADDWADALAARGLYAAKVPGLPGAGPGVSLLDAKDHWEMTVRDRKGSVQTVNVAPCTTPEEREDLLFYATTLLGPAPAAPEVAVVPVVPPPVVVATPPPATPPPADPPKTTTPPASTASAPPAAPAPPTTATSGTATTAVASGPTSSTTTVPTPRPTGEAGLWIGAGGGVGLRSAAGAVGDFHADGGWYLNRDLRIGVGLGVRTAAALPEVGEDRAMSNVDLVAEGAWMLPLSPVTPYLGAYGGFGIRSFTDAGQSVLTAPVPLLGGEVGVNVPLGSLPVHVAPNVRVQADMRSISLKSSAGLTPISPVEIRAGVSLVYRPD